MTTLSSDRAAIPVRHHASPVAGFAVLLMAGAIGLSPAHGLAYQRPITALAPVEVVADGFADARGVAVDGDGNVFVADRAAGTVIRIAPDGKRSRVARSLRKPVGLAFDATGRLLVAEEHGGRVLRVDTDGVLRVVVSRLEHPRWLATDEGGTIYVSASGRKNQKADDDSDDENDVVMAVSATGVASVFVQGLDGVEGLGVGDDALYVASRGRRGEAKHDGVVYEIPILAGGLAGDPKTYAAHTGLKRLRGLALDHVGAPFVAAEKLRHGHEGAKDVVAKLAADGTLTRFASNLEEPAEGLAFDVDGNLYVSEGRGGRVLRFRAPSPPVFSTPRVTRERVITVSGTTEAGATVDLYLDPGAAPLTQVADTTGSFAISVSLAPNTENHLYLTATGSAGRGLTSALAEGLVTHDDIPPSLAFLTPAAGATLHEPVTVQAQASDGGSRVVAMALSVDGAALVVTASPALPAGSSTASAVWDVSKATDGAHSLVAVATDEAGNVTTVSRNVMVENRRPPALTVSSTSVAPGSQVTVTLTNGLGGSLDWLALADASASNTTYLQWVYVGGGVTTRPWTVTMPTTPGNYEFRLFLNNGFTRAATSPRVSVLAGLSPVPSLGALVPARTVAGGLGFSLVVNGSNFVATSVVRWNGADLPTT